MPGEAFLWRAEPPAASGPHLLFLSHCVPYPPDKGEKIRAFQILRRLARDYRVHLFCFARANGDLDAAAGLREYCASIYAERLLPPGALARGLAALAAGGCLNAGYFRSYRMQHALSRISAGVPFDAAFVYTAVMTPYAPSGVPLLLDLVDVDSEKWFQYADRRFPGPLYRLEARRLRAFEQSAVERAGFTVLTTRNEEALLKSFMPSARAGFMENGIDASYFDDAAVQPDAALRRSRFIPFIGAMDYYPNVDGVCHFAATILPELRRRDPSLEFWIVGRNPAKAVQALSAVPGVRVLGGVPDVRPYLAAGRAIVAPLRLARGIQNKVLEALAMGRPVIASTDVCRTFGDRLPPGLVPYDSVPQAVDAILRACADEPRCSPLIRQGALERFDWEIGLGVVARALEAMRAAAAASSRGV